MIIQDRIVPAARVLHLTLIGRGYFFTDLGSMFTLMARKCKDKLSLQYGFVCLGGISELALSFCFI